MITIEIKENSKQAKAFIELAKTLSFVRFKDKKKVAKHKIEEYPVSKNVPNEETSRIIEKNKKTKGTRSKSAKELFEKLDI